MNAPQPNNREENPLALSRRFYKLAPGGRWYRQSLKGGYTRIKSRVTVLRLQLAANAKLVKPE